MRCREDIEKLGFVGFVRIGSLQDRISRDVIPDEKGVYLVLKADDEADDKTDDRADDKADDEAHRFRSRSTGGHFKGKDPTVPVTTLKDRWVKNTVVLYVGKAGGQESRATLRSRIEQYVRFGRGQPVGHRGGRYIWQLEDSDELVLCWKPTPRSEPRTLEKKIIKEFETESGQMPFANLRH